MISKVIVDISKRTNSRCTLRNNTEEWNGRIPNQILSGAGGRHAVMLFIEGQSTGFSCDETKMYT